MRVSPRIGSGIVLLGLTMLLAGCYQTAGSSVIPTVAELTATSAPQISLPTIANDTSIAPSDQASPTVAAPLAQSTVPAQPTLITVVAATGTSVPAQPTGASPAEKPTDTPFITAISTQGFLTPTGGGIVITAAVSTPALSNPLTEAATTPTVLVLNTPTALPTEGACVHTVQPGDHVYSIARQYKVNVNDLLAANPSLQNNPDQLQVGQVLTIPNCGPSAASVAPAPTTVPGIGPTPTPVGPTLYAVVKGDTLLAIAHKFNTTVAKLEQANGLNDLSILHIGQQLIIPPP